MRREIQEEFEIDATIDMRNLDVGEMLKEQGMERANGKESVQWWKCQSDRWFQSMQIGVEFASDDVLRFSGCPDTGANKCNVVGAWISGLSKSGRIRFTGQFKKSSRVARHAGLQRIWQKVK